MGLFNLLDPALDFIFSPILPLPPFFSIMIMALLISLLIALITKYTTNQDLMKQLKEEQKELQKEAKELRNHPEEAMKVNKKVFETNMKYMKQSMKSMIYTFIPIIIIFGWMMSNLSYLPIKSGEEFNIELQFKGGTSGEVILEPTEGTEIISEPTQKIVDGKAQFGLKAKEEGEYLIVFNLDNTMYSKKVIITGWKEYIQPVKRAKGPIDFIYSQNEEFLSGGDVVQIKTSNKALKPLGENISLLGWKPGWLGTYIILSIIFSIFVRKFIKVY